MAKYPISFPSAAMVLPEGEWEAVGRDAHAVSDEAKAAGLFPVTHRSLCRTGSARIGTRLARCCWSLAAWLWQ
jgi:hypothetical protein